MLKESLGGDAARSAILLHRVSKDGRAAGLDLVSSAGGQAKWKAVEDEKRIELTRRKWIKMVKLRSAIILRNLALP